MHKISAVIITLNEEKNIGTCIKAAKMVVDEVLVLDSFSNDNTGQICLDLGARVVDKEWEGYSPAKNYANSIATHDWILSLDADEVLSEELIISINTAKKSLSGAYSMNRLSNYCGKWIRHGGWYPDKKVRLFRKDEGCWDGSLVHEKLKLTDGVTVTHLHGDIKHYTYHNISDHINRVRKYAGLASEEIIEKGKKGLVWKMIFGPALRFIKGYFFQFGILDGYYGFRIAMISSWETWLKYSRAWRMKYNQ